MPSPAQRRQRGHSRLPLPPGTFTGFVVAWAAVAIITLLSYHSLQNRQDAADMVSHTLQVLEQLGSVMSLIKDAETGQRGFLLTGAEAYLDPYENARIALPRQLEKLRELSGEGPAQQERLQSLRQFTAEKLVELEQTVSLRRRGDAQGALERVRSDRSQATMDRLRRLVASMETTERELLATRQKDWVTAASLSSLVTVGGSAVLALLIGIAALMASRDHRARETQAWLRGAQVSLARQLQGEKRLDKLGDGILDTLARHLDAAVGAIYATDAHGRARRMASYGVQTRAGSPDPAAVLEDGLIAQVIKNRRLLHVRDVPPGYLDVASGLGRQRPGTLLIAPAVTDDDNTVQAVIELGFFRPLDALDEELLNRLSEWLGAAVRAARDRMRLEELLKEARHQTEELQTQQEELRVNNEVLEEQGRVLKESQARMEQQHAELEENNTQLEKQKEHLTQTQLVLTSKTQELERANQYKSEFLANMSHELRTPLNSSLILAKILADNKAGNLTAEQVRFAETILKAGNDLLTLINDILDRSKIEAGKITVTLELVHLASLAQSLVRTMEPIARQKGLDLTLTVAPGVPERIQTDAQRLGQILKNLLSNAIKFTATGRVGLHIAPAGEGIALAVSDSGVGIPPQQQGLIFEAFRQADGSTHRNYGGTGLGLTISRDLAHLLGGELRVDSTVGVGSTFTLNLPLVAPSPTAAPSAVPSAALHAERAPSAAVRASTSTEDDRDHLVPDVKLLLVVEDDPRFAAILRDLAHEMGFQCVVATSANEGVTCAHAYRPKAILLDSGLGALDQLKRDPETRHIPVHIISAADFAREALERGALGYALKPVRREQLVEAVKQLEAKFSQKLRRLLIVEDDDRQRESMRALLDNPGIEILAVQRASEALAQLQASHFDCMVMDLNLPDFSGYELLEKLSEAPGASLPPVIVYTGRTISRDEEHTLRRFSKSIIIKDAHSPERLLDEVTLFLHQVESRLPPTHQRMLCETSDRESALEGRRILVVEDDVRNVFALSSVFEPKGVLVQIARNGKEALQALERGQAGDDDLGVDLILMDVMMPEMDGLTAMREIRKRPEWKKLPIIALTAKAMKDDQEQCLAAGANDYIAKPLDIDKLMSLVRVWMPKK